MKRRMNGAALVITLWIVALATIMAFEYSRAARSEIQLVSTELAQKSARAAAEAGIWYAIHNLQQREAKISLPTDGTPVTFRYQESVVRLFVQDVSGLIDLNNATPPVLLSSFNVILNDTNRAAEIVDRLLDWRDTDGTARPLGAEDSEYKMADAQYAIKNAPFDVRDELQLVLGLTNEEYQMIVPYITVHSRRRSPDPESAPSHVLSALEHSVTATPAVAQAISNRSRPRRDTRVVDIFAEAALNSATSRISASIELNTQTANEKGPLILAWQETWPFDIRKTVVQNDAGKP